MGALAYYIKYYLYNKVGFEKIVSCVYVDSLLMFSTVQSSIVVAFGCVHVRDCKTQTRLLSAMGNQQFPARETINGIMHKLGMFLRFKNHFQNLGMFLRFKRSIM